MAPVQKKKPKKTRAEKSEENRRALMKAAADVVGELGYRDASVARITQKAGLAQGTFYLYFESRQDLFDQLLPHMGEDLLDYLAARVEGAEGIMDVEERGFRGFFEFLQQNPSFFRVLNEAEVSAPKAYEEHFSNLRSRYLDSLTRSQESGEITCYTRDELEVLVYMLMAARSYLYLRYSKDQTGPKPIPDWVVKTFLKFVRGGLFHCDGPEPKADDRAGG